MCRYVRVLVRCTNGDVEEEHEKKDCKSSKCPESRMYGQYNSYFDGGGKGGGESLRCFSPPREVMRRIIADFKQEQEENVYYETITLSNPTRSVGTWRSSHVLHKIMKSGGGNPNAQTPYRDNAKEEEEKKITRSNPKESK